MLLLVKHAMPDVQPDIPAKHWQLSAAGKVAAEALTTLFSEYDVTRVITSEEPKARTTGEIAATGLDLPWEAMPNLHEHDRTGEPFGTQEVFRANVAGFFSQPDQLVFGNETAQQAQARFVDAVNDMRIQYPDDTLAIVAHGTVITLLVAHYNDIAPFDFWDKLALPSVVALNLPDFSLLDVITGIA